MNCGAQFAVPQTCWLRHKVSHPSLRIKKKEAETFVDVKGKKGMKTDILIAEEIFSTKELQKHNEVYSYTLNHCLHIQVCGERDNRAT